MEQITIDIPAEVLLTLSRTGGELQREIRQALAVQFYLQERITLGQAAQLAGMSRLVFEGYLGEVQGPISLLSLEEVRADQSKLR